MTPAPVVAPTQYRASGGVTSCSGAALGAALGACARPETPQEMAITGTAATSTAMVLRMISPFLDNAGPRHRAFPQINARQRAHERKWSPTGGS